MPNSTQEEWRAALNALPSIETSGRIPAFFFGHGSPLLLMTPSNLPHHMANLAEQSGPSSLLARWLKDFGHTLQEKYKPKGILVFSAHWESQDEILVTDYDENPLLMDYYGFDRDLYQVKFKSKGSSSLSSKVVECLEHAGIRARTSPKSEARGHDGRGFMGPGLDHGVFVPFKYMLGDEFTEVPIVQASIDASLDPDKNYRIGKAVEWLRSEGILILSGGLTIHNLRDPTCWAEATAKQPLREFHNAVYKAVGHQQALDRKKAMYSLTNHPGFQAAHPREEHFIPVYVAAGAGESGEVRIIDFLYGAPTFAFGI